MLSFPHSLASNNLAGETGYIKKSEVQGSSFEVGAKVTYEGCEMTVSMAPDSDGDMKMIDLSGFMKMIDLSGFMALAAQGSHSEGDHCSLLLSGPPAAHTQSLSAARRSAL